MAYDPMLPLVKSTDLEQVSEMLKEHGFCSSCNKQEGEEHQHRQGAGRGGQRDGQGRWCAGLQGLGGGGIALVIEGDPHLIGHHGLEGLHGPPPLGVVQHRPAQLVAVEAAAEVPLRVGHPGAAVIILALVGDAHHGEGLLLSGLGEVKAVGLVRGQPGRHARYPPGRPPSCPPRCR